MADEKNVTPNPDAKATAELEDQDKSEERDKNREEWDKKHPGYKYYRKTRQFGG
jgi:hypothetical protein